MRLLKEYSNNRDAEDEVCSLINMEELAPGCDEKS
jgi:hypothetical protein